MKTICINCKATWDAGNKLFDKCPFCGVLITKEAHRKTDDFSDAISNIIHTYSIDILRESNRFMALLRDYAPGCDREIKLMEYVLKSGALRIILETDSEDINQQNISMAKLRLFLHEELMISEEYAIAFCKKIAEALEWQCEESPADIITTKAEPEHMVKKIQLSDCEPDITAPDFTIRNRKAIKYAGKGGNVIIPYGITSIGEEAFCKCSSLTSIVIPDSVTSIGACAFCDCSRLTSITIPNGVTSIGKFAFVGCFSLTSITIPNGVTSIGESAFSRCSSLTSIAIPNGVTSIGEFAFCECSSLTSIAIPDSVTLIGEYAFEGCFSLTSITIPNGVTSIGESAFSRCSSLTSIVIPQNVTSIGDCAFFGCDSLASITIPDSVTSIGDCAFFSCDNLSSIIIPESVTLIGDCLIPPSCCVITPKGSYADRYARKNGLKVDNY